MVSESRAIPKESIKSTLYCIGCFADRSGCSYSESVNRHGPGESCMNPREAIVTKQNRI